MSDDLLYNLRLTVERGADISEVESKLQELLTQVYEVESVEAVEVKDRTPPIDEDVDKLMDVIGSIESSDIRNAIDYVNEVENLDNGT